MEDSLTWTEAAIVLAGIGMITVIVLAVTVVAWQLFVTWRARAALAREEAYRELAQEAQRAQRSTEEHLETMRGALDEIRNRTAEVERMLKEVE